MYPYDDENLANNNVNEPLAENGEYHFIRPDAQRSYRDAEYTPVGDAAIPPRYYTPEEKPKKSRKPRSKGNLTLGRLAALCLVCALLGGAAGGAVTAQYLGLEEAAEETPLITAAETASPAASATEIASGTVSAGDIYEMACEQVVGISTEITTTNYFGMISSGSVSGSGFIISENGYIMTNYHVIEDAYEGGYDITVMLYDASTYTAEIIGFDSDNDIAVLKIDAESLSAVTIGNSGALEVGDTVYAIGNPLGELAYTMTSGIVSATDRVITTDESTSINMFQFDAAVNSGNSGGPVYNSEGQIVGIVTAKYSDTGVEGLGFAIPINDAVDIANELITNGYVTGKPNMGVVVQTVSASVAQYYNMVQGAYVYRVESGSCAEIAGLKIGDIITLLDGAEVITAEELVAAVKQHSAGDTVEVTVYRSGEYITLTITFDEQQPDSESSSDSDQSQTENAFPYDGSGR